MQYLGADQGKYFFVKRISIFECLDYFAYRKYEISLKEQSFNKMPKWDCLRICHNIYLIFARQTKNIAVHKIDIYRISIFTYACPNRQVNCDVITSGVQPTMTSSPERKHIKRTTLSMYENCPLIVTHGLIMSCTKYNYLCAVLNYALNRWLVWYSYPNKHQNNPRDIDFYDLSRQDDKRPIFSQKRDLLPTCGLTQGFTYTSDMRLGVWCFFFNAVIAGIIADRRCIKNRLHIIEFLKKSMFIDEYDKGTDYICHSNCHYIRFCFFGSVIFNNTQCILHILHMGAIQSQIYPTLIFRQPYVFFT